MPGVKGHSGAPGVSRKAGPGRLPKKFTLELGKQYAVSQKSADGKFWPIELATVVELDRKVIVLETADKNRITIFR
jgi:hypothetical protein